MELDKLELFNERRKLFDRIREIDELLKINSSIKPFLIKEARYKARIDAFQLKITIAPLPIKNDKTKDKAITLRLFMIITFNISETLNEHESAVDRYQRKLAPKPN